jgi:H+-translocating NAD(P) transhydrogenase subunit alpha
VKIGILKETRQGEARVAVNPAVAGEWVKKGITVLVEQGAGNGSSYADEKYAAAGAELMTRASLLEQSDILVQINVPGLNEIQAIPAGKHWISLLYHRSNTEIISALNGRNISAWSLDAIPRISRAQSMDVLSSQSNLAGYRAVLLGAHYMKKVFPLMMTAAGTITPSRVLIFGVGVAGLQAIATAKRLGAIVEATDVRPETKEQVESLGGKFIEVKGAEVASEGGYAKEAGEEYRRLQREAVNKSLAQADLVITTALVPGRKAPILIDEEQLNLMKPGSVLVDMAVEQGGNCPLSQADCITERNGVTLVGTTNLPATLATNASDLLARNLAEFIKLLAPKGEAELNLEDEILHACLICHEGNIRHTNA